MLDARSCCGVVLAGGKSRRMGTDKAGLMLGESTFLEKILGSMEGIFPERLVAGRSQAMAGPAVYADTLFVPDVRKDSGPLGGIYTALLLCKSPWALFVSCDAPLMDREILEKLCNAAEPDGRRIFLVATPSSPWGNFPLLVPKTYLRTVRRLLDSGERSVKSLVAAAMTTVVSLNASEAQKIRSINTPSDYKDLLRNIHALVA